MTDSKRSTGPKPVVRFAPSPTGFLHIGGARTALFNWLFAKGRGGRFLLRIEDTDRERNNPEAIAAILDGLAWLGLKWDGEPVSQFARANRHREVAEELLARGAAYRCYLTPEELDAMRKSAEAEKRRFAIQSPWRNKDPGEAPPGAPFAIRLKAPRDGETVIEDQVQGRVVFQNKELDDFIILRSDANPTYNLAVVVDDHEMGVTHIVRGVDHLTNAARQTQIYTAMGWTIPVWAHVPLIHGPDGAKLSKRHGALGVEAYRAMGYLPAALRNYLVRLGWSHGDDEIISTDQLVEWFGLDGIGKSPARFDMAKLEDLNAHYLRTTPDGELIERLADLLAVIDGGDDIKNQIDQKEAWPRIEQALPGLKERARTLCELIEGAAYVYAQTPISLDEKATKILNDDARASIGKLIPLLEAEPDWTAAALEAQVRAYAEQTGAKLGKVAQPLRAALTGRTVSPPVFDVMAVLGRNEALARLREHGQ
jgi:glutamyl-tRNA synthetase